MMDSEDVFMWPDGTWGFRREWLNGEYDHMSDDYEVIRYGTERWQEVTGDAE